MKNYGWKYTWAISAQVAGEYLFELEIVRAYVNVTDNTKKARMFR